MTNDSDPLLIRRRSDTVGFLAWRLLGEPTLSQEKDLVDGYIGDSDHDDASRFAIQDMTAYQPLLDALREAGLNEEICKLEVFTTQLALTLKRLFTNEEKHRRSMIVFMRQYVKRVHGQLMHLFYDRDSVLQVIGEAQVRMSRIGEVPPAPTFLDDQPVLSPEVIKQMHMQRLLMLPPEEAKQVMTPEESKRVYQKWSEEYDRAHRVFPDTPNRE